MSLPNLTKKWSKTENDSFVLSLNGEDVLSVSEHYYLGDTLKPEGVKYFISFSLYNTRYTGHPMKAQSLMDMKVEAEKIFRREVARQLNIYNNTVNNLSGLYLCITEGGNAD